MDEELVAFQKRRIEVGCLSGYWKPESLEAIVDDAALNFEEELDDASRETLRRDLRDHLRSAWARSIAAENTWTERTKLDRLDDALRDLARGPYPVVKIVGPAHQEDDPCDEVVWQDENDPLEDPSRGRHLMIDVDYDGTALHARAVLPWPHEVRRAEFQSVVDEVVRVLRVHGIEAAFVEEKSALVTERFAYQKRRTTSPPGEPRVASPYAKPTGCPRCGGKGWTKPTDPSQFPEVCGCRRPAA